MNSPRQNDGMEDAFTGPELNGFRERSLQIALEEIKTRKRMRYVQRFSLGVISAAAFALAHHASQPASRPVAVAVSAPTPTNKVEEISNEELLALFKDKPVAIIGSPGHQTFVVLAPPKPSRRPSS